MSKARFINIVGLIAMGASSLSFVPVSAQEATSNPPANNEYSRRKSGELLMDEPKTEVSAPAPVIAPVIGKDGKPIDIATPSVNPVAPIIPAKPVAPMTKAQIAKEIAPYFDTTKNYNRLVQCYGTADFLGALTNVRAGQAGATPQIKGIAMSIASLKAQMQPFVLATAQVKPETTFRKDYDKVARVVQNKVFASPDFNAALRPHLMTLDSCQKDVKKWRGGK
jgi:hypothetical protein